MKQSERNYDRDVMKFMIAAKQSISGDNTTQADLYEKLIDEEYSEFKEAIKEKNTVEVIDACFDMLWVIYGYMWSRGMNIPAIWKEGSASNLSKIDPETGEVLKREDGKVMKPEGWAPPDFSKFVR